MRHHPVRVRFRDLDALGHVNSSVYFTYMEGARVAFTNAVLDHTPWYRVPLILAAARCEFVRSLEEPVLLDVRHWVSRVGTKSWDLDYSIEDEDGTQYAKGRTTQVAFDHDTKTSSALTPGAQEHLKREAAHPLEFKT